MRKLILFLPFLLATGSCEYTQTPIEKYYDRGFIVADKIVLLGDILVLKSKDTIINIGVVRYDFNRVKIGDSLKSK